MVEKFGSRKFLGSFGAAAAMYIPSIVSWMQSNPTLWERYGGLILGTLIIVNWVYQEAKIDHGKALLSPAQLDAIYGTGGGEAHAMPSLAEVQALENLGGPVDSGHVEKAEAAEPVEVDENGERGGG